jgi:hypothetical protein
MRKTTWIKKVEPQAVRAIFLAKYLLRNNPDDPALEKLLTRLRDDQTPEPENTEGSSQSNTQSLCSGRC